MKALTIISTIIFCLAACSCSDKNDDETEFRYTSASPNRETYRTVFNIQGADVDDTFMAGTKGYCNERQRDFKIAKTTGNAFYIDFYSPNEYGNVTEERTDTSTIYKRSYESKVTINGKDYSIKTDFEAEALDENKEYYMNLDYSLKTIEMGGKTVEPTAIESSSDISVTLTADSEGTLVIS